MNILLTGATGFLGSCLLRALLKAGHQVSVLKRSKSSLDRIVDLVPHVRAWDIDRAGIKQALDPDFNIDTVVHVATCYGRHGESESEVFQANLAFPLELLTTAVESGVVNFINTDTSLSKNLNPYALSKKQFMEWGTLVANQGKISFVNIELEHFYGPGDDSSKFTTHVIKSCLENVPELKLTAGEQKRDFIYIDDVVEAYLLLLEKTPRRIPVFQEYGLGSGEAVTIREFVEMVHSITESKTVLNFGVLPYRENEIMESQADINALKALGWSAKVGLRDGLAKTVAAEKLSGCEECG